MNEKLYQMLHSAATADKAKALLSIDLLSNNPVGIGDHTTEDFYKNAQEELKTFAGAHERLEILEKYFQPGKQVI